MDRRKRDKSIKSGEIFKTATKVSVRRGPDGATIQEIAKEAHVGRATVYYHFPSKKVILKEILIGNLEKFFKDLSLKKARSPLDTSASTPMPTGGRCERHNPTSIPSSSLRRRVRESPAGAGLR